MLFVGRPYDEKKFVLDVNWSFGACFLVDLGSSNKQVQPNKSDYIFRHLHNSTQKAVTKRLNTFMQKHIGVEVTPDVKAQITTRSLRKGATTVMVANQDLKPEERIFRSGHTYHANADVYVVNSPAVSKPGGMVLAGWKNIRQEFYPANFDCLEPACHDSVKRFLEFATCNVSTNFRLVPAASG